MKSRNARSPAGWRLSTIQTQYWPPTLFDDGSVGHVADLLYDPDEWADYEPEDLLLDGEEPYGEIYIDRYRVADGETFEGGCYLYWPQDTLGSWCDRNDEPAPVMELPDWVWDALDEEGDADRKKVKDYLEKTLGRELRCCSRGTSGTGSA